MYDPKPLPVSAARPCPVCRKDHKCSTTPDGLIFCGRSTGPVPGFAHLGPCKDPTWHLYRRPDPAPLPAPAGIDFARLADTLREYLTPDRRADLAARLRLPADALGALPLLGFDPDLGAWTFPEHDPDGRVVGVVNRFPDGAKRSRPGSRRGLHLPAGWRDAGGPLFLVEGPTDVIALTLVGLAAVGRPSNSGGVDFLARLLADRPRPGPVFVVGENDRKPDGLWPGRAGAEHVARELARRLPAVAVALTMPPPPYKDVRDWVADRLPADPGPAGRAALGREVAAALTGVARTVIPPADPPAPARAYPVPVPITSLGAAPPGGVAWVWDGFLARGSVTLLSALPKAGKTTLLSGLLQALPAGGLFAGRPLAAGRAVVISEEPTDVWLARRDALGLTDRVRLVTRPFFGRPGADEWTGFIAHLADLLQADDADLVVFDTLANLWPVKDENQAAEVLTALLPLQRLTAGRAVLLDHHLRKADGREGTGSRGSGGIAGFVDILVELRRAGDPAGRGRLLKGYGRHAGIPDEWLVTRTESGGYDGGPPGGGAVVVSDGKALREAIRALLPIEPPGLTRKEIWDRLPAECRKHEVRFKSILEAEVGRLWGKSIQSGRGQAHAYWRIEE